MPRTASSVKGRIVTFRGTDEFKQNLRLWAESIGATDGEFIREAVKYLGKSITDDPSVKENMRSRFS